MIRAISFAVIAAALGTKFNQKEFHDFILAQGLLPPDLMRDAVMNVLVPRQQAAN